MGYCMARGWGESTVWLGGGGTAWLGRGTVWLGGGSTAWLWRVLHDYHDYSIGGTVWI